MSSSASDTELISNLKSIIYKINLYFGSFIFFIGSIGNILNIIVLSQRRLRSNTCVMIFIASSITGLITLLSGPTSRILSNWDIDMSESIRWICKSHAFLVNTFRSVTFWLIMLATIDRWIVSSTNARFRYLSSKKNILRSIFFIIFLSIIIHCPIIYCYEPNLTKTPLKCFNKDKKCRLVSDLIFIIVTILIPLISIVVFGWMTILNVRLSQTRIEPITTVSIISHPSQAVEHHRQRRRRQLDKTDNYLLTMLFIQVILFACLTLPLAIQRLYATLTMYAQKSKLHHRIENFIYEATLLLTYVVAGMQFYINTLSGGRIFRKALIDSAIDHSKNHVSIIIIIHVFKIKIL